MGKKEMERIEPEFEKDISGGSKASGKISDEFKEKIINTLMKRPSLLRAYGRPPIKTKKTNNDAVFLPKNPEK